MCKVEFRLEYDFSNAILSAMISPVFGHLAGTLVDALLKRPTAAMLEIEIVYGLAERQVLKSMTVAEGTTIREAVPQSSLEVEFPELDLQQAPLGIFGKAVKDETALRDGDRIEVYRPLLIDPKEARRKRAEQE